MVGLKVLAILNACILIVISTEEEPLNVILTTLVTHGLNTKLVQTGGTSSLLKGIVFQCDISSDEDLTGYVYDIQWFINDNSIVTHRNIPYTNLTQTGLHQSEWIGTYYMSFLVKCAVRARIKTDSTPTTYTYSDAFYAGIQTDLPEYTLSVNGTTNITVSLTVPIDCLYPAHSTALQMKQIEEEACGVTIRFRSPAFHHGNHESSNGGQSLSFDNSECEFKFKFTEWNTPKNITIYRSRSCRYSNAIQYIQLDADARTQSYAWRNAARPDIKVNDVDQYKFVLDRTCTIQTGIHFNMFDGRALLFRLRGEFILLTHETLPIRIHAVFDQCWQVQRGSCACGLSIRHMDAVFVINFCKMRIGERWLDESNINRYAELRASDGCSMAISFQKGTYSVKLPHGMHIDVVLHLGALNVHINMIIIRPTLAEWRTTSGMCGFLDGDPDNDIRLRNGEIASGFGLSWRQDSELDGDSMFLPGSTLRDIPLPKQYSSRCPVPSLSSSNDSPVAHGGITFTCKTDTEVATYIQQCNNNRKKRETPNHFSRYNIFADDDIEVLRLGVVLDETRAVLPVENITWKNGWNESLAEEACRNTMDNDPMLIKCKEAIAVMYDITAKGINKCVGDIKISGHSGNMDDTLNVLHKTCLIEAERFENLTTKGPGTAKTILHQILQLSCQNSCSGNGHCIAGICVCQTGFYGHGCAQNLDAAPEILSRGLTCSINERNCRNFVISGINFLNISLSCQARLLKVYSNRTEIGGSPLAFPARYLNDFSCICTIPDYIRRRRSSDIGVFAEGYLLSISNDGINYSEETTVLTYDSRCYDCNPTTFTCVKLKSCH